jgi:hypothetical protein
MMMMMMMMDVMMMNMMSVVMTSLMMGMMMRYDGDHHLQLPRWILEYSSTIMLAVLIPMLLLG